MRGEEDAPRKDTLPSVALLSASRRLAQLKVSLVKNWIAAEGHNAAVQKYVAILFPLFFLFLCFISILSPLFRASRGYSSRAAPPTPARAFVSNIQRAVFFSRILLSTVWNVYFLHAENGDRRH